MSAGVGPVLLISCDTSAARSPLSYHLPDDLSTLESPTARPHAYRASSVEADSERISECLPDPDFLCWPP